MVMMGNKKRLQHFVLQARYTMVMAFG